MLSTLRLVLAFVLCLSFGVKAQVSELYTFIEADNITPPVPVFDFFGTWKGAKKFNPSDYAYAHDQFELGARYTDWSFAVFARLDYSLQMHPEVGEYRFLFHNARTSLQDKDYIYDFFEQRLVTQGVKAAYDVPFSEEYSHFQFQASLNLMHSSIYQQRDIRDGYINGVSKLGDADARYFFNEDTLYTLLNVPETPHGYGGSIDLSFSYKHSMRWSFGAEVKDLLHQVHFADSPFAFGRFRYEKYLLDEDGVRDQLPLVDLQTHESGKYESLTMNMPTRVKLWASYRFSYRWKVDASYRHVDYFSVSSLKFSKMASRDTEYGFTVEAETKSLGVHYHYKDFAVQFFTDNLNVRQANRLNLSLAYRWKL